MTVDDVHDPGTGQGRPPAPVPAPSPPPGGSGPAVDGPTIERLSEDLGGGDVLAGLVDLYLEEGSAELAELTAAAHEDDPATVLRVAHAWRPGSAAMGALGLVRLLEEAERVARADAPGLVAAITEVAAEYTRVGVELSAWGSPRPGEPAPAPAAPPAAPAPSATGDRGPSESLLHSLQDRLEEVAGTDAAGRALIGQLVDSYLQRARAYIEQLGVAVGGGDRAAIATDTHTLAGMAGNVGARGVPERCSSLAAAAAAGDWAQARTELAGLGDAQDDVREALLLLRADGRLSAAP